MKIYVLVPTYRRPAYLTKCLRALEQQTRPADQVLIVIRSSDDETQNVFARSSFALPLRIIRINVAGQVAALNAGLDCAEGDVVAITDDDAAPHRDWIECIERHFLADASLGGVGGRDYIYNGKVYTDSTVVGKIQWFGRHIGNHHRGIGSARDVDVLKGVNMSYRMSAIQSRRFDTRLLGSGAQTHNDMAFSLRVKRAGWRLLYDPCVAVDHFTAERFDDDGRSHRSPEAVKNEAHNETVAILEYLTPCLWPVFLFWSIAVGHRSLPGALQCLRLAAMGQSTWWELAPVCAGRVLGLKTTVNGARFQNPGASGSHIAAS